MPSSDELAQKITELEQELQKTIKNYSIIANERHELQRKILEIRIKLKDLDIPFEKVKLTKAELESSLRVARAEFWRIKGEGM